MTGYEKGCEELGLRGSGAQAIGSKRTSFGGKRPASLGRTCCDRGFGFKNTQSYWG